MWRSLDYNNFITNIKYQIDHHLSVVPSSLKFHGLVGLVLYIILGMWRHHCTAGNVFPAAMG